MVKHLKLFLFLYIVFVMTGLASAHNSHFKVIESNENGLILEMNLSEFKVNEKIHNGTPYQIIVAEGMGNLKEPGSPQVLLEGIMIEVPSIGEVTIEIIDREYKIFSEFRLYPAPEHFIKNDGEGIEYEFAMDESIYTDNSFFPAETIKLGKPGKMREHYLQRLIFFPVQFNPVTGELKFYNRLRVSVSFSSSLMNNLKLKDKKKNKRQDGPFEKMLKKLIVNYN